MMPYTVEAEYRNQIIPEYQGNPLIEALPDIWSTEQVIGVLSDKAAYNNGERKLDIQYRLHCIHRLFRYFQPWSNTLTLGRGFPGASGRGIWAGTRLHRSMPGAWLTVLRL